MTRGNIFKLALVLVLVSALAFPAMFDTQFQLFQVVGKRVRDILGIQATKIQEMQASDNIYYTDKFAILVYRHIDAKEGPNTISPEHFVKQIDTLKELGYNFISLEQAANFLEGKGSIPANAVVVTFDDGYDSFYRYVYPVLKQRSIPASMFIVVRYVGVSNGNKRRLSWEEMKEMQKDGLTFYSHTYDSHYYVSVDSAGTKKTALAGLIYREDGSKETVAEFRSRVEEDLRKAKELIEANLEKPSKYLALPFGIANEEAINIAQKLGHTYILTTERGLNDIKTPPSHLLRFNAGSPDKDGRSIHQAILAQAQSSGEPLRAGQTRTPEEKAKLLKPYPLINDNLHVYDKAVFDKNGILLVQYEKQSHYNPTSIAIYALRHYAIYYQKKDSQKSLDEFLKHANWLRANFKNKGSYGVWEYEFGYPQYEAVPPWISGLSQGLGISVMIEAWKLTGDESFLQIASLALNTFKMSTSEGGVKSTWPDGSDWFEEYPSAPNSHVLNGFIFALAGIHDYYEVTGDKEAKKMFDTGVASLRKHIGEYDIGFTSLYDQDKKNKATAGVYHLIHIHQLLWLHYATGDDMFHRYAKKWLNYDTGFIKKVTANNSVDPKKYGPKNLIDGKKYYGYWSSNKLPVNIVLDMGKKVEKIEAVVFYAISPASLPTNFSVSTSNDQSNWSEVLVVNGKKPEITGYNKTGNNVTNIGGYKIRRQPSARYVKITINKAQKDKTIGLREIDVHFDQTKNINGIYKELNKYFEPS